jgi:hypothetical protein
MKFSRIYLQLNNTRLEKKTNFYKARTLIYKARMKSRHPRNSDHHRNKPGHILVPSMTQKPKPLQPRNRLIISLRGSRKLKLH